MTASLVMLHPIPQCGEWEGRDNSALMKGAITGRTGMGRSKGYWSLNNRCAKRGGIGRASLLVGCALGVLCADAAVAEQFSIEEIMVTARKREENIRDVPDTIQAFTAGQIQDANIGSVNDVTRLTTNFSIVEAQQPGVVLINIRGVAQVRNGEAPIAMVVDGVQANIANQITQSLFDIEQIEVLKGPQGSLYGRNAIGGAINIVTKQPTNEFDAFAEAGWAEGNELSLKAGVGGPIVEDKVLFRLTGSYLDRDGQIDNVTLDDEVDYDETWGLRGTLKFLASDNLTLTAIGSYQDTKAGASWYVPIAPGESNSKPKDVIGNRLGVGEREISDISLKAEWETSAANVTLIGAYSTLESFLDEELDWLPLDILTAIQAVDNDAYSTELRIASPDNGGRLTWLLGGYYLHVDRDLDTIIFLQPDNPFVPGLADFPFSTASTSDSNDSYAVFGQASYEIQDNLELTVGLRYDLEEREQADLILDQTFSDDFDSLQPKVSLSYAPSDDLTTYVTVAKGFRSGGFNANAVVTRVYDSEELWSYEVGAKSSFLDGRLAVNVAAFYTDISNRQVYGLDLSAGPNQFIANPIPEAHVIGAEVELIARPMENLDLAAGFGFLDSEIDTYDQSVFAGTAAFGDFEGNELNQMPTWSFNFSGQYTHPLTDEFDLVARVDVSGSGGDYYWEIDNQDKRSSQVFTDLRLSVKSDNMRLTFFVENLFDEGYVIEFVPVEWSGAVPGDIGAPGRPRQFGVSLRYDF